MKLPTALFATGIALLGWLGFASPCLAAGDDLGPGDTVRISVFRNPELTTEAPISSEGLVTFPLIGSVRLAGRTTAEAGTVIADALRRGDFVRNAQVSVSIVELRSRRVSVLGHVARPGQFALDGAGLKLTEVLALAGGISETGASQVVVITEGTDGEQVRLEVDVPAMYRSGDLSRDIALKNGDTVFVPSAPVFYVSGAVQRAGAYRLEPGTLVHNALSLGGGLTPRGTDRGIRIHRRDADGEIKEYGADLSDAVQPDDVIYFKERVF